ncbi:hypothetical protein AAMO2058_000582000 [Amorphochlora amoebiformis]
MSSEPSPPPPTEQNLDSKKEGGGLEGGGGSTHKVWLKAIRKKDAQIHALQCDFDRVVEKLGQQTELCRRLNDEVERLRLALRAEHQLSTVEKVGSRIVSKLAETLIEPKIPKPKFKPSPPPGRPSAPSSAPPPPPQANFCLRGAVE